MAKQKGKLADLFLKRIIGRAENDETDDQKYQSQ